MNAPSGEHVTEWAGGSLSELMSVLSAAALPARIRVFAPGSETAPAGEVHLLAGGLNDAFAGDKRGQDAATALQRVTGARFVIDTRLPDPETGSLAKPGPAEGSLAQRPLVEIMRYCEDYVLTCTLEVRRGEEQARISYRRGELVGTWVGGSEAPERLPEVMGWKEGFFEIDLPLPVTPPVPAPSRRTASSAVVGESASTGPARPASGERARRGTDPFITLNAIKRNTTTRPAGAMRSTGEVSSSPRLPPGPPLPGLQSRIATAARAHPAETAGPRPAPSGPIPSHPLAAPPSSKAARAAQASVPPLAAPVSRDVRPARAAPLAPVPWPRAKPPVAQPAARPVSAPAARPAAFSPTPARGSAVTPTPSSPPASLLARVAPVRRAPPSAPPRSAVVVRPTSAAARPVSPEGPDSRETPRVIREASPTPVRMTPADPGSLESPRPMREASPTPVRMTPVDPRSLGSPRPMREASPTPVRITPAEPSRTPGKKPSFTPPLGMEALPFGVELPEDMQDPAAFVETPQPLVMPSMGRATPTPISPSPQPMVQSADEFAVSDSVQPEDLGGTFGEPGFQPDQRPARRGAGDWPLLVHVLLGVALGAAIAAAYSAYYGLPLRWP